MDLLRAAQRNDGGIARNERAHRYALACQRGRQCADHIGQAAGLDQRIDLGGDCENAQRLHLPNRSIIGCVIRQMPRAVRRKRLASSTGSSPTTSPAGICTPRVDDDVCVSRAPRPIST